MRGPALAALLFLTPGPAAATEGREAALKNLRYNLHSAFLRSYLHEHGKKLSPAPGWIRRIGAGLGRQARLGAGFNFNFYLVDLPDANATATPHGTIILHQGMLDLGLTQEEVGALMAHEIAHLVRDHAIQRLVRNIQAARLASYQAQRYGKGSAQLAYLTQQVRNLSFNREEEHEADEIGVALLKKAGMDTEAMAGLLEKLNAFIAADGRIKQPPPYLSSHPPTVERIARVREAAGRVEALSRSRGGIGAHIAKTRSKKPKDFRAEPESGPGQDYNLGLTGWRLRAPAGFKLVGSKDRSSGKRVDGELSFEKAIEVLDQRTGRPRKDSVRFSARYGTLPELRNRYERSCSGGKAAKPAQGKQHELPTYQFRCPDEDGFQLDAEPLSFILLFHHGGDGARRGTALKDFVEMQKSLAPTAGSPAGGEEEGESPEPSPQRIPLLR